MDKGTCSIEGCEKPVWIALRGWCCAHYTRWQRHGDPLASAPRPTRADRFWAKVTKTETCWLWTGSKLPSGYGKFGVGGKYGGWRLAHRVAYELATGQAIPPEMTIDHLCWNPECVRPAHLQMVTQQQNNENRSGPMRRTSTGIRGVSTDGRHGGYTVQCMSHGQYYRGGHFDSLEEAEAAAIALRNRVMTNNLADRRTA